MAIAAACVWRCALLAGLPLLATNCSSSGTLTGTSQNESGSTGAGASTGTSATSGTGASGGTSGAGAVGGAVSGGASSGATAASTGVSSGSASGASSGGSAESGAAGGDDSGTIEGGGQAEAGSTPGDASSCSAGVQVDPGAMGDGTTMIAAPYVVPPESMSLNNGAPAGTLTTPALYASKTAYSGIKFQYTIYVPAQYQKGKPAALMIFLDGREWVTTPAGTGTVAWMNSGGWHADYVLDNMIQAKEIPVTIAVFIDPGTKSGEFTGSGADNAQRSVEYDHPDDVYSQFTLNEFLPDVVLANYDIVQDPDGWSAIGHSSGGIAVFNMGMLHPDKFHKILTFSASFPNTGGVYPNKINTLPLEPLRIHLLSSPNDLCCGWYMTNTEAAADLKNKGYHYQFIIGTSPHFPTPAGVQDFPNALRWMWRGYTLPCYP